MFILIWFIKSKLKDKYKYDSDIKIEFYRETRHADSIGDSFYAYSVYSVVVYFNGKYIKQKELKKVNLEYKWDCITTVS